MSEEPFASFQPSVDPPEAGKPPKKNGRGKGKNKSAKLKESTPSAEPKVRKSRKAKADPPELSFIQLLMMLKPKQRQRVLFVLNKIFA